MSVNESYLQVAIPVPLYKVFDYLPPVVGGGNTVVLPGMRVKVPFGNTRKVGLVVGGSDRTDAPTDKLRPVDEVLDDRPVLDGPLLELMLWAADYYVCPPGEALFSALPVPLRKSRRLAAALAELEAARQRKRWKPAVPVDAALKALRNAPAQARILAHLMQHPDGAGCAELACLGDNWRRPLRELVNKKLVDEYQVLESDAPAAGDGIEVQRPHSLNAAQQQALDAIIAGLGGYQAFLVFGDTGSGKTEVYFQAAEAVLRRQRQVLILVPEIGLTPQLVHRFRRRFRDRLAVYHSGLSDNERLAAWHAAGTGSARVVLGTRSAVFVPLAAPGLVIVDEEHDLSYKQQDGFRYSARDIAVMRARRLQIPVVLGSATPSLESLYNVESRKFVQLRIPYRAASAAKPEIQLIDLRRKKLREGISAELFDAIGEELARGCQVLLFLNRRGFSPTLLCHDCGWTAQCTRCDARLTFHAGSRQLRCHHCGIVRPLPEYCGECDGQALHHYGYGTERIESVLQQSFTGTEIIRIDRDTTRRKDSLQHKLELARTGERQILIGTQMLAKGHHFPNVTLVGVIDSDQGLFGADFRASERMMQLILQVAGRAGRARLPGRVLVQTHCPDHPLMRLLPAQDYQQIAAALMDERRQAALPPYHFMVILRAESTAADSPIRFLEQARQLIDAARVPGVECYGPHPAPMEKRAGRYRAQLLLQSDCRRSLYQSLRSWLPQLTRQRLARRVSWSVDVDPQEVI